MKKLDDIQLYMKKHQIDAWLIYDYQQQNPVMKHMLTRNEASRRVFVCIPQSGNPVGLVHQIDQAHVEPFPHLSFQYYTSWQDLHQSLNHLLSPFYSVAMDYSECGNLPSVSFVDAGTVELIKQMVPVVLSSQDLFQLMTSTWSEESLVSHKAAAAALTDILYKAFDWITCRIRESMHVSEFMVQQFIMEEVKASGLETKDRPVVAAGRHTSNPHYEPTAFHSSVIRANDLVLIDLWAKYPGESHVYADITWMGYVGERVPDHYEAVFQVVRNARDQVIKTLESSFATSTSLQGWELDQVARTYIAEQGYGSYFVHRTGHSLSPGTVLHGHGANLDNFETRDNRTLLAQSGFSVEPGIYLPEFGVRSEINVYINSEMGVFLTTPLQTAITPIMTDFQLK